MGVERQHLIFEPISWAHQTKKMFRYLYIYRYIFVYMYIYNKNICKYLYSMPSHVLRNHVCMQVLIMYMLSAPASLVSP